MKKSIVLSGTENTNKKAVLTLQEDNSGVFGSLRLYNFSRELDGISSLGLNVAGKVHKAGLTLKGHMLYQFFLDLKQIPAKFSAAVVSFVNASAKPVLYGSTEGNEDAVYASIISQLSGQKMSATTAEAVLDAYGVDFADEEKQQIEADIDACMAQDCANCTYKKYFYEHNGDLQNKACGSSMACQSSVNAKNSYEDKKTDFQPQEEKLEEKDDFFFRLKPQIDNLFKNNPTESSLQDLIPSSKFVKVECDDDGDFYVFGLLYDEDNQVKYVCYGLPAVFEEKPPEELSGYPIWLPLDKQQGFGYWLTYQDAATGQPVKAVIE